MLAANEAVAELLATAELALPAPRPPGARSAQAQGADRVRHASWASRPTAWKAASSCSSCWPTVAGQPEQHAVNYAVLRSAAAGRLQPEGRRPLRPGQRVLLPLHVADPPLSRPDDPPAARRDPEEKKPRNDLAELVVLGQHCSDREQRAEAAERELTKVKLLAYLSRRSARRWTPSSPASRIRPLRARHRAAGRRADPRQLAGRRLLPLRPAARTPWPAIAAGNRYRLGDVCAWPWPASTSTGRELDFRIVTRGGRRSAWSNDRSERRSSGWRDRVSHGASPSGKKSVQGGRRTTRSASKSVAIFAPRTPDSRIPAAHPWQGFGRPVQYRQSRSYARRGRRACERRLASRQPSYALRALVAPAGVALFFNARKERAPRWPLRQPKRHFSTGTSRMAGGWSTSPAGRCRCNTRRSSPSTPPRARRPACSISRTWGGCGLTGRCGRISRILW